MAKDSFRSIYLQLFPSYLITLCFFGRDCLRKIIMRQQKDGKKEEEETLVKERS